MANKGGGSEKFLAILDDIRQIHLSKSSDYGSQTDPLANVRAGADFIGVEPWRACLVRVADKIQRLKTFCRDGRLTCENVEDTFLDLASYSILALVLFRETSEEKDSSL